jgi:hypothetical protein
MPNDHCSGRSNASHRDLIVQGIDRFELGLVAAKPLDFPARHHSMRGLP